MKTNKKQRKAMLEGFFSAISGRGEAFLKAFAALEGPMLSCDDIDDMDGEYKTCMYWAKSLPAAERLYKKKRADFESKKETTIYFLGLLCQAIEEQDYDFYNETVQQWEIRKAKETK